MQEPGLIIVRGLPGTGKSTIANGVSSALGFPVFSVDPIESAIIASGIARCFETGLAAYKVAQSLAGEQLRLGNSAIIDSVSAVKEAHQMWADLVAQTGARSIVVECVCSDTQVHRARLSSRVRNIHGIPEVEWDDVEVRRAAYVPWDVEALTLDTLNDAQSSIAKAIDYILSRLSP